MASTNFKLFDENKTNMMSDTEYNINTQRLNGVQAGIASSQLQNKTLYQTSLVAYSLAQIMMQNGYDANDSAVVSAFVSNMSNSLLQKVLDKATTVEAQNGVNNTKWMTPALTKAAIDILAAKSQNILSNETKTLYGLGANAVPNDVLAWLGKYNQYWWSAETAGSMIYLHSADRNAYPDDGMQDGYEYKYLGIPFDNMVTAPKIETGSYVGTGTYGSGGKNSLTFGFVPAILIITVDYVNYHYVNSGYIVCNSGGHSGQNGNIEAIVDGNTVSWYSGNSAQVQLNTSGLTYKYVAIGQGGNP